MMQTFIFILTFTNSLMFLMMNHPLSLGFLLMTQTLLISLFTGIFTNMFWFSYALFLIFMGGMLILFMYMTSLASNEMFKFSIKPKIFILMFSIMIYFIAIIYIIDFKSLLFNNKTFNNENSNFFMFNFFINNENKMMLNKMFNFPMNLITILLVNYLFLTLIATVKITNIFQGPLRPKNLN